MSISITTPAERSTVAGQVDFKATARSAYTVRSVRFYVDGALHTTDTTAPFSYRRDGNALDTTVLTNGWHRLTVKATAAGNRTATNTHRVLVANVTAPQPSPPVTEPTPSVGPTEPQPPPIDSQAPSAPSGLTATNITATGATLSWSGSTDNVGVTGYDVLMNGATIASTTTTSHDVALACSTSAVFAVAARDAAGNAATGTPRNVMAAICPDTAPPSSPGSPSATAITQTAATLTWSASTDNVGVVRYDVFRAAMKIGSTTQTTFPVTLPCGTTESYSIVAFDAAGNGSPTAPVSVTTVACTTTPPPGVQPLGADGAWTQIWGDEFNGSALDESKWSALRGDARWEYGSPFNPSIEDAFYTKNNVTVNGGNLVMTLKKEAAGGYPYSSGMVQSGQDFGFRYGFIEARTYAPKCAGCWPAFWMLDLPLDDHWPPEIDIFEYFDSLNDPMAYFNYHYEQNGHKQTGVAPYGDWGGDLSGWHTFGLDWSAGKLQTYIDGRAGPSYASSTLITKVSNYILFNFALEKGDAPPTGRQFLVDYVRVWQ
ncbi:MAG: family 16 glycosylhydrolase [Solirubrobacterales bacterium]